VAECEFVDPVADITVLCSPDNQSLFDEADAYDALVEDDDLTAWMVAAPPLIKPPLAAALEIGREWSGRIRTGFAQDSSLEGDGFEPSVPREREGASFEAGNHCKNTMIPSPENWSSVPS
jgi:hypothetical protein